MSQTVQGRRVAFLLAPEGIEQIELTEPGKAVEQAGGIPELISVQSGTGQAFRHLDKADTFPVDRVVTEAKVDGADSRSGRKTAPELSGINQRGINQQRGKTPDGPR